MDITNLSLEQLKALAYDYMSVIQQHQNNLSLVNAQIQKKSAEVPEVKSEPKTKK